MSAASRARDSPTPPRGACPRPPRAHSLRRPAGPGSRALRGPPAGSSPDRRGPDPLAGRAWRRRGANADQLCSSSHSRRALSRSLRGTISLSTTSQTRARSAIRFRGIRGFTQDFEVPDDRVLRLAISEEGLASTGRAAPGPPCPGGFPGARVGTDTRHRSGSAGSWTPRRPGRQTARAPAGSGRAGTPTGGPRGCESTSTPLTSIRWNRPLLRTREGKSGRRAWRAASSRASAEASGFSRAIAPRRPAGQDHLGVRAPLRPRLPRRDLRTVADGVAQLGEPPKGSRLDRGLAEAHPEPGIRRRSVASRAAPSEGPEARAGVIRPK